MEIPFCSVCARHLTGQGATVEHAWQCALCFGILDPEFIDEVAKEAKKQFDLQRFDSQTFVLALNVPVSVSLREAIIDRVDANELKKGTLYAVPFKLRIIDAYIGKLKKATGVRPILGSDLTLTITFVNDEFNLADTSFLLEHFKQDFMASRKRRRFESDKSTEANLTKVRVGNLVSKITPDIAARYNFHSPTQRCSFSFAFERDTLFLAGRYCKFSRNLPQSPWTAFEDVPKKAGNSVSEKITAVLKAETLCNATRFIASGREDIDVRMLGNGRPFVVECLNPHKTQQFYGKFLDDTLHRLQSAINADKDIKLGCTLKVVNLKQTDAIRVDQEDKRKCYTAYCYSTEKLTEVAVMKLSTLVPLEIMQKTPVRVLKRRSLLDRKRTIFLMQAFLLDDFHFLLRLETQAGTYVKEFVHGDFGRTVPSLADLLGVTSGEIDIIDLDVERVDMIWPPY